MPYKMRKTYRRYKRKSYRRKTVPKTISTMRKIARQVMLRSAETKSKVINYGKVELYHDSLSVTHKLNFTAHMPSQGTGQNERIGDTVTAKGYKIRFLLGSKYDRPNVTYRVVVFAAKAGVTPTYGNVFNNICGNGLLDDVNRDRVTLLRQKYYKPNKGMVSTSESGQKEYTSAHYMFIPRKKTYKFNGLECNDRDLYLCVLAYDAYGSLTTDNIAYITRGS